MRIFSILFITVFLFSCQNSPDTITLSGSAAGIEDGTEMYLYKINENNQPEVSDTLLIENERFSYEYPVSDTPELAYFSIKNRNGNLIFFPEDKDVEFTVYKDSLYASTAKGGTTNTLFSEYNSRIKAFGVQKKQTMEAARQARKDMDTQAFTEAQTEHAVILNEEKAYKKEFVKTHKNSLLTIIMMNEMIVRKELTSSEAKQMLANIAPELKQTFYYDNLLKTIEAHAAVDVGQIAPNFSAPTPDGETLALNDVLGKVTLIDFWASWCKPCRMENPNVVKVYNQYKDKGFEIISVSLDRKGQKSRWLKAIEDDQMAWHHVSNLNFWNDPIAKEYGVRSIPATFLLDEEGRIIAKDLRGDSLGRKVGELLD